MKNLSIAALIIFVNLIQAYSQSVSWGEAFSPFTQNYQLEPVQELGPTFDAEAETNGKIHIVWGGITASGVSKVYYSSFTAGAFSAPQQLSASGSPFAFAPDLDILPDGRVAAVWSEYTASGSSKAMYSVRALNGNWSTPTVINPADDEAAFVVMSHLPDGRPLAAYSEVEFDEINQKILSNVRLRVLNANNNWDTLPSPPIQVPNSNYRADLLLLGNELYCAWIDGGNPEEAPSNNYVALSVYQDGTWSARKNLSLGYSLQIIDDFPITLKKNAMGEVTVFWYSLLPFSQQLITLTQSGQDSVLMTPFTPDGTGVPVFGPDEQLIVISDDLEDGELFITQLDNNNTWETPTLLHNTATEYIEFPEAITWKDSILVLWLQEGNIKAKAGKFLSSSTGNLQFEWSFDAYPNPISDRICVEWTSDFSSAYISVFDAYGRSVLSETVQNKDCISLNNKLPAGAYWVQLQHQSFQSKPIILVKTAP